MEMIKPGTLCLVIDEPREDCQHSWCACPGTTCKCGKTLCVLCGAERTE